MVYEPRVFGLTLGFGLSSYTPLGLFYPLFALLVSVRPVFCITTFRSVAEAFEATVLAHTAPPDPDALAAIAPAPASAPEPAPAPAAEVIFSLSFSVVFLAYNIHFVGTSFNLMHLGSMPFLHV